MKALHRTRYGPPEVLVLRDVPKPSPGEREVLVRVHAASVNAWDWDVLTGNFLGRLGGPLRPKHEVIGGDLAGVVEAVGTGVTRFRPGDAVFGDVTGAHWGAFAEFASADEKFFARKPEGLSFVDAAAIPQAGTLALQGLRRRTPEPGHHVLVNGAGGGVGSFAVQLAKRAGATVTAVDHGRKRAFLEGLRADHVLDYTREDFARSGTHYDLILDPVMSRPLAAYARALGPRGALAVIGGRPRALLGVALKGPLRRDGRRYGLVIWQPRTAEFDELAALAVSREIRPAIDEVFPLARGSEALRKIGEGRTLGKVMIEVVPEG